VRILEISLAKATHHHVYTLWYDEKPHCTEYTDIKLELEPSIINQSGAISKVENICRH